MNEIDHFYFSRLPIFAVALAIVFLRCKARRKSPWSVVLWLPAVVFTCACTLLLILQTFGGGLGGGPDAGWGGMANLFRLLFALPIIIAFSLFLFVSPLPDAWQPRYVFGGILAIFLVPFALGAWFKAAKATITFHVTDAAGSSLSGVELTSGSHLIARSASDGSVRISFPHSGGFGVVFVLPQYQQHSLFIRRTGEHGETFHVDHTWLQKTNEHYFTLDQQGAEYPSNQPVTIPIEMRPEVSNARQPNGT